MEPHISVYYIRNSYGSLHRSMDDLKKGPMGSTIRTLNLDLNFVEEVPFKELTHLPGERTYRVLLPVSAHARWPLLIREDIGSLLALDVGHNVFFKGDPVSIRAIGPVKTSCKGWFYLLQYSNRTQSSVYTSIDTLRLCPLTNNNGGVNGIIQRFETAVENKNYANSYYSHHQNAASPGRLSGSRALATPSPSQSYINFSDSMKHHPLGHSKDALRSRTPETSGFTDRQTSYHNNEHHLSKSEIDGQISYISSSGGRRVDGRSHEPSSSFRFPSEDPYYSSRGKDYSPRPGMIEDLTYTTVIKEDNQKRSRRYIPHPPTELSFTTALNILDEEDSRSTTMKDSYQSGCSSLNSRTPTHNNNNNNDVTSGGSTKGRCEDSDDKVRPESNGCSFSSIKALNCEFDTVSTRPSLRRWEIGSLVEVHVQAKPLYGVIKWMGRIHPSNLDFVGIELEERLEGAGDGVVNDKTIFETPPGHGVFVTLSKILKDKRFDDSLPEEEELLSEELANMNIYENNQERPLCANGDVDFGFTECPSVPGFVPPMDTKDFGSLIGRNKGIQGYHNSCYLDSTIFAMFSFTSVFDFLLYRTKDSKDIKEYSELQKVLREDIVNPLRTNFFVRADKVMKLRKFLGSLSNVRGLTSEEKDPEELLNSLLCETLKAKPFLYLSSGQTSHYYQLFVERDEFRKTSPTVQELFEQSFFTSDIKLKSVPSVLILQMPRFGRQFKVYDKIRPTQILDITDIIEGAPRQCTICGNLASLECHSCFGLHGNGLDSTAFCRTCHERTHSHKSRQHHSVKDLSLPHELLQNKNCTSSRLYMKLFAVLCIETSHYVTFTKCGDGPKAPWCLFDSMADRKGEANGYNIPEVSRAHDLEDYFMQPEGSEEQASKPLTPHVKRLLCDGYMYFYQSKEVMMYQ